MHGGREEKFDKGRREIAVEGRRIRMRGAAKVFSFAVHRYNCSVAPYEVWRKHLMKKRARSAPPAVIASWTDE